MSLSRKPSLRKLKLTVIPKTTFKKRKYESVLKNLNYNLIPQAMSKGLVQNIFSYFVLQTSYP